MNIRFLKIIITIAFTMAFISLWIANLILQDARRQSAIWAHSKKSLISGLHRKKTEHESHNASYNVLKSRSQNDVTVSSIKKLNANANKFRRHSVFVEIDTGDKFLFGAAVLNSSSVTSWNYVAAYGQWSRKYRNVNVSCCIKYGGPKGPQYSKVNITRQQLHFDVLLESRLFFCPNHMKELPTGVTAVDSSIDCPRNHDAYVPPYYPLVREGVTLGICAKVAHDRLGAEMVIEWMEVYKHLGLDKVIVYIDESLNENAKKVLKFYEDEGIMETFSYHQPGLELVKRNLRDTNQQVYTDRHTLVLDCTARLAGYTYAGVIDFDEFIVPSRGKSLKKFMRDLQMQHPDVAGFSFLSSFYVMAWGKGGNSVGTILSEYTERTSVLETERRKNLYITQRVNIGGVGTHVIRPKNGYKTIFCDSSDAILRHYRQCIPLSPEERTGKETDCIGEGHRVFDDTMIRLVRRLQGRIEHVRQSVSKT